MISIEQGETNVRMINRGPVRFRCLKPTWPPAFIARVIDGDIRKTHRSTWDPRDLIVPVSFRFNTVLFCFLFFYFFLYFSLRNQIRNGENFKVKEDASAPRRNTHPGLSHERPGYRG